MAVPPLPPILAQLGQRPFSFYPAILNLSHNEWTYQSATWSEVLVRNSKTNEEIAVPRRYVGDISSVEAPVMIVGLRAELEYRAGAVYPAQRKVIEMPLAVNDSPRPPWQSAPVGPAQVVGIRVESGANSRMGKLVLGGVALGLAGCVLAISLFRGGVIASRVFYTPSFRADLPLTPDDDYASVVRLLGPPEQQRWRLGPGDGAYEVLAYPRRGWNVILMGPTRAETRYWHPMQAAPGGYPILRRLPKF
jgi:hypothetical protein